jgi:signal transduction histidine kinase
LTVALAGPDTVEGMATRGGTSTPRPPLAWRLSFRQWLALDAGLALAGLAWSLSGVSMAGGFSMRPATGAVAALDVLGALPVAFRRLQPLPVLAVVTAAVAALTAFGYSSFAQDLMIGAAIYLVAVGLDRSVSLPVLIVSESALAGGLLAAVAQHLAQPDAVHSILVAAAAWFAGDGIRSRRKYLASVAEQAAQDERIRAERERQAVGAERVRIARELHDIVAHSLSVMTIRAGVGRRVIDVRPAEARDALRAVEVAGRGALDELRRILDLLRDDDTQQPGRAPAPGIDDLPGLVKEMRAAGIPVDLSVTGDPGRLPPAVGLSAYRIIQEALTNVVKHAGQARAAVRVRIGAGLVRVVVTDDGPGRACRDGEPVGAAFGHGIIGMRERAAALGGTLTAGPRAEQGFEVIASLPIPRGGDA